MPKITNEEKIAEKLKFFKFIDGKMHSPIDSRMLEIRHNLFNIHAKLEEFMDRLYQIHLFNHTIYGSPRSKKQILEIINLEPVISKLKFKEKLGAYTVSGCIPAELSIKIGKVNTHRNYFSHPTFYEEKLKKIKQSESEQADILNNLYDAFDQCLFILSERQEVADKVANDIKAGSALREVVRKANEEKPSLDKPPTSR